MTHRIQSQQYGKADVRLTKITRGSQRHEVIELSADILLEGDFDASYMAGDNRLVVPTDTMKNTVYALAKQQGVKELEPFGQSLGEHFVRSFDHVSRAVVRLTEDPWQRLTTGGVEHPTTFLGTSNERATCEIVATGEGTTITSGLTGLRVLKTADSGFTGFLRDVFTTLAETKDRLLATTINARWQYVTGEIDWTHSRQAIRRTLLEVFAGHQSRSVQHTLYALAEAALDACDLVESITLQMPNRHRVLVDLAPLGMENDNEIFAASESPHGHIEAVVHRGSQV